MTTLDKIIQSRKSTYPKDFNGAKITKVELEELMSVTVFAPNHKKTRPWRYHIFTNDSKARLGEEMVSIFMETTNPGNNIENKKKAILDKFDDSDVVICIVHHISNLVPIWEEHAAIAMSVQNLWLKSTEMGLGGYWSTPGMIKHLNQFLNLAENEECLGLFYLGKTNNDFPLKEMDWKEFVKFHD